MNEETTSCLQTDQQAWDNAIRVREGWAQTMDMVPDVILLLDNRQRILRANKAAARQLGCSPEDLVGRTCYEVIHGTAAPPGYCPHVQMLADGLEHRVEICEERLGGTFSVFTAPIRNEDGEIVAGLYVARDITELKRVETDLRIAREQVEQRLALTVAVSMDGFWEWDIAAETVKFSERFTELLDYSHDEVPSTLDFFRSVLHPDDADATWAAVDRHWEERLPSISNTACAPKAASTGGSSYVATHYGTTATAPC